MKPQKKKTGEVCVRVRATGGDQSPVTALEPALLSTGCVVWGEAGRGWTSDPNSGWELQKSSTRQRKVAVTLEIISKAALLDLSQ